MWNSESQPLVRMKSECLQLAAIGRDSSLPVCLSQLLSLLIEKFAAYVRTQLFKPSFVGLLIRLPKVKYCLSVWYLLFFFNLKPVLETACDFWNTRRCADTQRRSESSPVQILYQKSVPDVLHRLRTSGSSDLPKENLGQNTAALVLSRVVI